MSRSNSEVDVLRNPPIQPNGIITGYVGMYSIYKNNTFNISDMLSENDRNFIIGNLGKFATTWLLVEDPVIN